MSRHTKILSRSFAGGEMSPEMFSRVDDSMFQAGAETLKNCIPRPTGAVTRRPGTQLVREVRDSAFAARLYSFVFSQDDSIAIEAGRATIGGLDRGYFRFHTGGGTLLYPAAEESYVFPVNGNGGNDTFTAKRTVSCTVASPTVVTLVGHNLQTGDEVEFTGSNRSMPDDGVTANSARPLVSTTYYVEKVDNDTFRIYSDVGRTTAVNVTEHAGHFPVMTNTGGTPRWENTDEAKQGMVVPEHPFRQGDPVVVTMWPDGNSPSVTFKSVGGLIPNLYVFEPSVVGSGYDPGLPQTNTCNQQVIFVATGFGGTLPPNLVEGKVYWVTGWTGSPNGWYISETQYGAPLDLGGTGTTSSDGVRMCAMPAPELYGGIGVEDGAFEVLKRYYAIKDSAQPNVLGLENTVGNAALVGGGVVTTRSDAANADAQGCGPFKFHRAYNRGDIVALAESSVGIKSYYCRRAWWDPEEGGDIGVLTSEMHNGSGSRSPGSTYLTSTDMGAYWQEMAGVSTGAPFRVTLDEYTTGSTDLTVTSVSTGHGLQTGMPVAFVDGTMPAGITEDTIYYAIVDDATTFRLATAYANAIVESAIVAPTDWSPRHGSLMAQAFVGFGLSGFDDRVAWPSHGLSDGDPVVFSDPPLSTATVQDGLELGRTYYVQESDTNSFKLSTSAVGPSLTLSGTDGSLMTANGDAAYEVPHDYSADELASLGTTQSGDVMTLVSKDHPVLELRRLGATKWETREPSFTAAAPVPQNLRESLTEKGEGVKISSVGVFVGGSHNGRHTFVTDVDHQFQAATPVYVDGLSQLTAGNYIVGFPSGQPGYEKTLFLQDVDSGDDVDHSGAAAGLDGRIRYGVSGEDQTQSYKVTAIDSNNEESVASDALTVTVNLNVPGSNTTITWAASAGAVRYRVYKEISGLYGLIGETDSVSFKDDNIGPDLGVSPPIADSAMRQQSVVTFDASADVVNWTAHGMLEGSPVVFRTSDQMPGITEGATYYVLNPGTDEFQLAASPSSSSVVNITGTDTGRHYGVGGDFPGTATYFEGRRVFGGSRVRPQDIRMTASGTESDMSYSIPTVDSDRIYFRVAAREISNIRHLIPLSQLVLLSDSTEFRLTPLNDDVVTPSSISVRPQSYVGCGTPQPSLVNNTVVFVAARGGHVRELGYNRDVLGYLTGDMSLRAGHLFDGLTIEDQAYAKAPVPVVWFVSSNGKLLGLTYIPEEGIGAWHQHVTDGDFEAVTVVPEGNVDATYVIVKRTIGDSVKRFVERIADMPVAAAIEDSFYVDCGVTYNDTATTTITGLGHLEGSEGDTVAYLADGLPGTAVITGGTLTLPTAASKVHVGLPFTTDIKTLPLSMMRADAFGTGKQKNINQVWVRVFEGAAFKAGYDENNLRDSRSPADGVTANDLVQVTLPGNWNDDGQILVRQDEPTPLTVSGITLEVASGG